MGTFLYGINGDVPLDRYAGFFGLFVLNRVYNFLRVSLKQGVYFVLFPKQGPEMKGVVLHRVAVAPYPNMGQVPPGP